MSPATTTDTPSNDMHPLSARPTYTTAQLETYLSKLPCNPPLNLTTFQHLKSHSAINALRKLHLLQLAFAPFGSLAMHYSPHRIVSIDPEYLYNKIVHRGQGGYCMELNCFWSTVLRSLGYDVYIVGARVSHAEMGARGVLADSFGGYGHEVVIVVLGDGEKWLTDVGFGGRMSLEPIRLEKGRTGKGLLGWCQRLDYRGVADFTQRNHRVWVVDVTDEWAAEGAVNGDDGRGVAEEQRYEGVQAEKGWRPAYCFSDVEWLPADFEVVNWQMCRNPRSFFVRTFIMTRPILDEEGVKCVGQLTLMQDELSRTMDRGGKDENHEKEVLAKFTTEKERVEGLRKWFGVELSADEVRGMRGGVSEIRG